MNAVAAHFGVAPGEILSAQPLHPVGLLAVNQTLVIPKPAEPAPYTQFLLPDSEIINSDCGRGFNIQEYVTAANGKLASFSQVVDSRTLSGVEVVKLVAEEASVNPRFLLAFIEYRSRWVSGSPAEPNLAHPLGLNIPNNEGLYLELSIAANLANTGYYAWREGQITELAFLYGGTARIAPDLNAGSVSLQYLFARMFPRSNWEAELYGGYGFLATYRKMFGDPLACARTVEPIFPNGLTVPTLELPFAPGETWALTGGLHSDWIAGTPSGAIDFAPVTGEPPCAISRAWLRALRRRDRDPLGEWDFAAGPGGWNRQTTGWELLFMHVSKQDRPAVGTRLKTDDPIGHPSCEGGLASGTHVHIARLYRGEWIGAGDAFPFLFSGWRVLAG